MDKNKKVLKYLIAGIILFILILLVFQFYPRTQLLQGEVVIRQISLSPRIAGRINKIDVKEGDQVKKGQVLAQIDSPELFAKQEQAKAAQAAAIATAEKADKGLRDEEIDAAYNLWQKALSVQELADKSLKRVEMLYKEGVVSAQKLDETKAKYEVALQDTNAAHNKYIMAKQGARDEDKSAAQALTEQALGAVKEIGSYVEETQVKAPIDGEIATIVAEEGELAAPGLTILTMLNTQDIWLTFNIREDFLPKLTLGKIIEVKIPALDKSKKFKFKISYISKQGDFATWSATKTHGDFDLKTFELRAVPAEEIENLRQGMTTLLKI
jgi:Multidrug resistance efflux pump